MKKVFAIFAIALVVALSLFWKKTSISPNGVAKDSSETTSSNSLPPSSFASSGSVSEASSKSSPSVSSPLRSSTISNAPTVTGAATTGEIGGAPALAAVTVKGKEIALTPDQLGYFPRVLLGVNETVKVVVSYPEGTPEDPIVIQAEDGGHLNQGEIVAQGKLDASRQIGFDFKTAQSDGIYRVTVRKGFDEKRLDFWVGPEMQSRKGS